MKRLIRRKLADADVMAALDFYITTAPEYAVDFIDAIEQAYQHIQKFPASGSPRYGIELNLPELRSWACTTFSYVVFYVELPHQVEVWRVLHSKRDIPNAMQLVSE